MYITCVCLFSALSRRVCALQISIIIIIIIIKNQIGSMNTPNYFREANVRPFKNGLKLHVWVELYFHWSHVKPCSLRIRVASPKN